MYFSYKQPAIKLSLALIVWSTPAYAYNNSPGEIILGLLGLLAIGAIGIYAALESEKKADDPENLDFADQTNLAVKLSTHLADDRQYRVDIFRQSGNLERSVGPLSKSGVSNQILSTMKRAKIDVVSINNSGDIVRLGRSTYNARGRQEGKRIGSFDIIPL